MLTAPYLHVCLNTEPHRAWLEALGYNPLHTLLIYRGSVRIDLAFSQRFDLLETMQALKTSSKDVGVWVLREKHVYIFTHSIYVWYIYLHVVEF